MKVQIEDASKRHSTASLDTDCIREIHSLNKVRIACIVSPVSVCMYIGWCVCAHSFMRACVCMCMCMYICWCVYVHTCMCVC